MHSIESFLPSVAKPARYTGGEWNMVRKDPAAVSVRFALALPDVYEVGMSNLGLKILYGVLNDRQDTYAERAYCPWPDMEQAMRETGTPLTSLETQTPLRDFDAVGVSLQYEMTYSNILTMLDLGGIPLTSADRADNDPLIVGGGPCAYNPEPLADFFDCFVIGEGEELIGELTFIRLGINFTDAPYCFTNPCINSAVAYSPAICFFCTTSPETRSKNGYLRKCCMIASIVMIICAFF